MSILPCPTENDVPEQLRSLLARANNMQRTVMHSAEGAKVFLEFGDWIRYKSLLDPRLRQMAILQVAYLLENDYVVTHHVKISREFGVTDADMAAIIAATADRPTTLDAPVQTALRAVREMTTNRRLSDETAAGLREHFSPQHIVELVLVAGFYTFVTLLNDTLRVDVEDAYKPYLRDMPFQR